MERIILVRLTKLDDALLNALKQNLEQTFRRPVDIRTKIISLEFAWDASRRQYESPEILVRLREMKRNPGDKILGVVDVDLYSPEYDYIYGEAEIATGIATLSLYRLRSEQPDSAAGVKMLEERAVKEAIHEVGHLYGLRHCRKASCVMRACPDISNVDEKMPEFCPKCSLRLSGNTDSIKIR